MKTSFLNLVYFLGVSFIIFSCQSDQVDTAEDELGTLEDKNTKKGITTYNITYIIKHLDGSPVSKDELACVNPSAQQEVENGTFNPSENDPIYHFRTRRGFVYSLFDSSNRKVTCFTIYDLPDEGTYNFYGGDRLDRKEVKGGLSKLPRLKLRDWKNRYVIMYLKK